MTPPIHDEQLSGEGRSSLVTAVRVLRERWWMVAIGALAGLGISLALSLTATKEYEATSKLLLRESNLGALINAGVGSAADSDPQREAATNLELVTSRPVAVLVRQQLRLSESIDDLLAQVDAKTESEADIVDITVTDSDPLRAASIATQFARQYVVYRQNTQRDAVEQGEDLLRQQIDALPSAETAQRERLESALQNLLALKALQTGDAAVVDDAAAPSQPSKPLPKRDAAIGLILGLVAGIAAAFIVDLFDRRLKTVEDFEALYGVRALASIPTRSRSPMTEREQQAALEPFRILRSGLRFVRGGEEAGSVLVTSAVAGEGKTAVAASLARVAAMAGQHVILVEADLRRPSLHEEFDIGREERGLTTVLIGGAPARTHARVVSPRLPTLELLPSGPLVPNSAELLRSPEMAQLLSDLRDEYDLVILDAPPLLPVADAQSLLDMPALDVCVVVGRAYSTTRDEVRRTRTLLDRQRRIPLGLVVNGVHDLDSGYDYYGPDEPRATRRDGRRTVTT